jgi:hypothetical protein
VKLDERNERRQSPREHKKKRRRYRLLKRLWRGAGDRLGFPFYVLALALVVMAGWAAYSNVARSGWNSDAAAWVQAAGSIAAVVGAAWIAQDGSRKARRLHRERNEEAAWYVWFAIRQAQFESQIIASELVNRTKPVDKSDVREWRQRAITSSTGMSALANRNDHIHPAVTQVTSNAKILMDDLVTDLAALNRLVEEGTEPDDELIGLIVAPHRALFDLMVLYDSRMRGIRSALDDGGDSLPIMEWAAWNADVE